MDFCDIVLHFGGMDQVTKASRYRLVPAGLDVEIEAIASALSANEWTFARERATGAHGFVLVSGTGTVTLGGSEFVFNAPCAIWLPAGQPGSIRLAAGARGSALAVSESALSRAVPVGPIAAALRQTINQPLLGISMERQQAANMLAAMDAMAREAERNEPGSREAIMSHLTLILIAFWRLGDASAGEPHASPRLLVQHFMQLVELHIRDHWSVRRYATELGISTDRLNSAVQRATGVSPLALIHRRLVEDAEAMLERSTLQVAEIADALGFRDPAYFNRFFTRATGLSPGRFRTRSYRQRVRPDGSFAAWP